jgi:pyruvate dehydrogenase E1 component beta subunit
MREISFQKALEEAVAEEMRRDARVITMGTDFTGDPVKEFGPSRVRFTPISEAALTGMGLGAAGCGFRPIVNWRMVTFSFVAMDQIVNQASKIRYMFGGQADFPVTYRCTTGGGIGPGGAAFAEPVLDVDAPGRAQDHPAVDAGRRQGALEERDPGRQPRGLVRVQPAGRGHGPGARRRPRRAARRGRREARGTDVTIVALAYYVARSARGGRGAGARGHLRRGVDPRTLVPLDVETVRASVRKTGRCDRGRGAGHLPAASEIAGAHRRGPRDVSGR